MRVIHKHKRFRIYKFDWEHFMVWKSHLREMVAQEQLNWILTGVTVITTAAQVRAPVPCGPLCRCHLLIDHYCSVRILLADRLLSDHRRLNAGVLTGYVPWLIPWWLVGLTRWLLWEVGLFCRLLLQWHGVGCRFRVHGLMVSAKKWFKQSS